MFMGRLDARRRVVHSGEGKSAPFCLLDNHRDCEHSALCGVVLLIALKSSPN
jgi:hypothetical protein